MARASARPDPPAGLLLTHGAGSGPDHRELLALDRSAQDMGLKVYRHTFGYRALGRRAPDRAPILIASIREAADRCCQEWGIEPTQLLLGGRSMGGRMCSMAVAEGMPAAGLVLISYPLHPPGKPERLRVEHLGDVPVPTLAVSGTRDPFGTTDELDAGLAAIGGELTTVWIERARHELTGHEDQLVVVFEQWLTALRGR